MKKIYLILAILSCQLTFSQGTLNAINDTLIVYHEDSISKISFQHITNNDFVPTTNQLHIDTIFYNGTNFAAIQQLPPSVWSRINYKAFAGFSGWDSIQYVVSTINAPIVTDTAFIYIFVAQKSFEVLNLNNINARIGLNALFYDNRNSIAGFEVPKGSGRNTIFAANPWVTGKYNDTVYANVETYGVTTQPNNFISNLSGPISNSYAGFDFHLKWDRVWKVNKTDLQYHFANWQNAGYQPPQVFLDWPAHGDTTNGQAFYLAPFVDNNNDGVYNPFDGDYPKIKGQQAIYFIRNDSRTSNTQHPMQSEVHGMAYAYDCPSDSAINHTVFLDLTVYNRSNRSYDSTYIGLFSDFDLGNSEDDYVGCDVDRSTFYGYNGDVFDEDNFGQLGYGTYIPYQGVTFLKGVKQDNDGTDNAFGIAPYQTINGFGFGDGIIDNEHWGMEHFLPFDASSNSFNGFPNTDKDYYHYQSGKWKDSTVFVFGGNGHISGGGTIPTKYLFPGNSDTYFYGTNGIVTTPWSGSFNFGSDIRGVGSSGPFTLLANGSTEITVAFVFGIDYTTPGNFAGLPVLQERVDSIRSYFLDDFQSVCGGTITAINENAKKTSVKEIRLYPNPFNNQFIVEYELEKSSANLTIYNLMGVKVAEQILTSSKTMVDLSNVSNGIYFAVIVDGNIKTNQKIVKQ